MKYTNGLIKRKLPNWLNKEWYHQRFDGSPYFMWMISEGEIATHLERKKGMQYSVHFVFYENDNVDWYILQDDNKRITNRMIEIANENPNISAELLSSWKRDEALFYKRCIELSKKDLAKLADKELIKLHDEIKQITINRHSSSSIIDGFALGSDEIIAEKIRLLYEEKKPDIRYTELFSSLTAPVHLSFINEAEVSLLKKALLIKKRNLSLDSKDALTLIKNQQEEYFWIHNNYVLDNILSVDYFKDEIKKILNMEIDLSAEINKIEETPIRSKERKKSIIAELKPSQELLNFIKISEDFTYWQDERKKSTFWATHYLSLILAEIAKRADISLHEIKYMTCSEVSNIFIEKSDRKRLQERISNSVYYMDSEGTEALTGKSTDEVRDKLLSKHDLKIDDFRGLTASMGKAIGKVKILKSAKEICKVEQGDILVAVMTRPDYVPAMKKAAAIVTDEGGVTCHAAIVSRELGIPCIIGTKIATKVLSDGMLVEVNANHGWVKIIKE